MHEYLLNGVEIEIKRPDGTITGTQIKLIDFECPANNDWLAVNQFTVIENQQNRRPDVVLFVNGLPLGVIELKNATDENASLDGGFRQLQVYKQQIPSLFRTNALLVVSDGLMARLGSLTSDFERFMPWRTVDGITIAPKGTPELHTLINGIFEHSRFLDLVCYFTVFQMKDGSVHSKLIAGYHQFHAVRHAMRCTINAACEGGNQKIGVIWHTQGSGKSLLMAFYAGRVIADPSMANPTLVVITDRNDLDDQLFGTFSSTSSLFRQTPVQANSREDLRSLLAVASGGVIFTTMQKFMPSGDESAFPLLTDRRNVIVMTDEAHRSQYGFKAKVDKKTGDITYGFAKHLRDALPHASFIGFTGTPIEKVDVNTPAIFGDYIDVYDITRAVEDGATVPIYYESRFVNLQLKEEELKTADRVIDELTEDEESKERENKKSGWSRIESIVGAKNRLSEIAADIVRHFEDRLSALDGKGMIVCMSRRICVDLYSELIKIRPDWHSADDKEGAIKIVMTGNIARDPNEWLQHTRTKARRDLLAQRLRDPNDPLKLVIVRDMWLTGFDAPCLHTLYVDKPMHDHGLMQAFARVNRVFRNKPGGLVVDYIGIFQNFKKALAIYSPSDRNQVGIDQGEAILEMMRRYEIIEAMFYGFDYKSFRNAKPLERLHILARALEWILEMQNKDAARESTETARKTARRRFSDAVRGLSEAYALAVTSPEANSIREDVAFFQAIQAALTKSEPGSSEAQLEKNAAVRQLIDRAVVPTGIVDILKATGIQTPDISILSDAFLGEIRSMPQKNLAVEALRKLLNNQIRSRGKTNLVKSKEFSERLNAAVRRYHNNAITTAELMEELIKIAKSVKEDQQRGETLNLSEPEIAFYDALAENESAVQALGNEKLRLIVTDLVESVRDNASLDWMHRENARAKLRIAIKKILKEHGYPPDMQDSAAQNVIQQAEVLAPHWCS